MDKKVTKKVTKKVIPKKNPWRPRKFEDAGEMFNIGYEHLMKCGENDKPLTITGLVLALGCNWDTFHLYQSGYYDSIENPFSDAIKNLRLLVENGYEKLLFSGRPVGGIFALKNFNWKDAQQVETTEKQKEISPEERKKLIEEYMIKNQKLIDIKATDIVDIDDEDIIFDN